MSIITIERANTPALGLAALRRVLSAIEPLLKDGRIVEIEARPARRNGDQNRLLHAEIAEIAKTIPWAGRMRDVQVWKRLLVASWLRARGESVEILPALDGHGIDVVFRHTSRLTMAECAELIEFIQAWKEEHMPAELPDEAGNPAIGV